MNIVHQPRTLLVLGLNAGTGTAAGLSRSGGFKKPLCSPLFGTGDRLLGPLGFVDCQQGLAPALCALGFGTCGLAFGV